MRRCARARRRAGSAPGATRGGAQCTAKVRGTRCVRLVRGEGRGVSDHYGKRDAACPVSTKARGRTSWNGPAAAVVSAACSLPPARPPARPLRPLGHAPPVPPTISAPEARTARSVGERTWPPPPPASASAASGAAFGAASVAAHASSVPVPPAAPPPSRREVGFGPRRAPRPTAAGGGFMRGECGFCRWYSRGLRLRLRPLGEGGAGSGCGQRVPLVPMPARRVRRDGGQGRKHRQGTTQGDRQEEGTGGGAGRWGTRGLCEGGGAQGLRRTGHVHPFPRKPPGRQRA